MGNRGWPHSAKVTVGALSVAMVLVLAFTVGRLTAPSTQAAEDSPVPAETADRPAPTPAVESSPTPQPEVAFETLSGEVEVLHSVWYPGFTGWRDHLPPQTGPGDEEGCAGGTHPSVVAGAQVVVRDQDGRTIGDGRLESGVIRVGVTGRDSEAFALERHHFETFQLEDAHARRVAAQHLDPVQRIDEELEYTQWAIATLEQGIEHQAAWCVLRFAIPDVPEAAFYEVTVASTNPLTFSHEELDRDGWRIIVFY